MFVVDASVTLSWCFTDEATPTSERLLDRLMSESAIVPSVWHLEIANALITAERRSRMTSAEVTTVRGLLAELPIEAAHEDESIQALVATGRECRLSAYDAFYLMLAQRRGLPLATSDRELSRAATDAGVALLT